MSDSNWRSFRGYEVLRAMMLTKTTTAAAQHLGISQSAVSRSIANLEERFGKVFFERVGNRLEPTAEAIALNGSLDGLFASLAEINGINDEFDISKPLILAAPPTIAENYLMDHVGTFANRSRSTSIVLDICTSDNLISGVAEGRFDLGITDMQTEHSGIRHTPFRRSSMVCIMRHDDPLAQLDVVSPQDLDQKPLIALTRRHSIRTSTERVFQAAGAKPRIRISTATTSSAVQFVRMGMGYALVNPFPVHQMLGDDLLMLKFEPNCPFLTYLLSAAEGTQNAIARSFIRHMIVETPPDTWSKPV